MWLNVLLTLPTTYSWQMHYHKNADISIILVFYEILNYGKHYVSKRIKLQILAKTDFVVIKC